MKKILTTATAILTLVSAGAATAQSYDRGGPRYEQRHDQRSQWERQAPRRYVAGRYQAPRGYQARQWRRGDRLPANYRGAAYRVDHRRYGLETPPPGYEYTRVGNDVVLTAVATGVIAAVIFGLFQ